MDAHVPQRAGVVRLRFAPPGPRWPAWLLAIAWTLLLAWLPWWAGLPWLLGLAAIQLMQPPLLSRYGGVLRRALRWGMAGLLVAGFRAFANHGLGLTVTALAALAGFSLLVLLESWQDHKPRRSMADAAAAPEWRELALAPIGPSGMLIELRAPDWIALGRDTTKILDDVTMTDEHSCMVGTAARIDNIEPKVSLAPGRCWLAWPMAAGRGVVLYDRAGGKQYRLRGWQLYGWHAGEAWLSRSEDQPPLALPHVLGQEQRSR